MKKNFLFVFILLPLFSLAQKNYDCIVHTKNGQRYVGFLYDITDSSITVANNVFKWNELKIVRFRKHNGYMRTVVPITAALGLLSGIEASSVSTTWFDNSSGFNAGTALVYSIIFFIGANIEYGMPIYFLTRNHTYRIKQPENGRLYKNVFLQYQYIPK